MGPRNLFPVVTQLVVVMVVANQFYENIAPVQLHVAFSLEQLAGGTNEAKYRNFGSVVHETLFDAIYE